MLIGEKCVFIIFICNVQIIAGINRDWWKYTTIYEIFVSSFKDSNGDGIGDLKGITSMLDHFVDLGIETLWLTPIYESTMLDSGYDVSDYYKINPTFGTMEDFDELMREMKKRKLKLMMDFILNHSSNEHQWFLKSIDRVDPYTDYYVWKDAKGYDNNGNPIRPNNWLTYFNKPAWRWNAERKQFCYGAFSNDQVDFDLRNPRMLNESLNIIKFWFDKGVMAGRLDATVYFMEDTQLRDEDYSMGEYPLNWVVDLSDDFRKYTRNLWESYEFIHELRKFIDSHYNAENDNERIIVAEAYTTWNYTFKYYGTPSYKIVHFPFNYVFSLPDNFESPKVLDNLIKKWLSKLPDGGVANWQLENHDLKRLSDQICTKYSDIMLIVIMTLPGVACIYYGQEIGMVNTYPRSDQLQDHISNRDAGRSPMQWDDSINAGFSSNSKTWLPVNPNYWQMNVKTQKTTPNSRYNLYKSLSILRQTPALKHGNFTSYLVSSWIYAFVRSTESSKDPFVIVVANMGSETVTLDLHTSIPSLPPCLTVVTASMNAGYVPGSTIYTSPTFPGYLIMRPSSAIVFSAKENDWVH